MDNKNGTSKAVTVKRNLVSIATLFNQTSVPNVIDYMSLDVEGAESLVMEYFPWNLYSFKFLTIERPKEDLKQTLKSNGYRLVMILSDFGETLWIHKPSVLLSRELVWRIAEEYNNRGRYTRVMEEDF
jgi:hypothetical protein